jgi:glycosyltransferase involved in cell wall biosynthesis
MIPSYNPRADYLEETLRSVLRQDPGAEQMQIEVVDDCSPNVEVETLVKSIAGPRVAFSKTGKNLGLARCWNKCIERSSGDLVHILHQDDYVLPRFYERLTEATERHPELGLFATRSFFVDEEGVVEAVTPRLRDLEDGGRVVDDFFYSTPIQCPGVVVRRSVYDKFGGFRVDLKYTLDCEMWARTVASAGGLVTKEVLSCYRLSGNNESSRLSRTAETLYDLERLSQIFTEKYPGFDRQMAAKRVCNFALGQAEHFSREGDDSAASANLDYWQNNAPLSLRMRRLAGKIARIMRG